MLLSHAQPDRLYWPMEQKRRTRLPVSAAARALRPGRGARV